MKQDISKKSIVLPSETHGFTLVELMIAMVLTGIIVGSIYSAYLMQQRTYVTQEQVAQMQQNIRAGMDILKREVRMAGFNGAQTFTDTSCDIGTAASVAPGIKILTPTQIGFSMDLNADGDCGDPGENLTYSLYVAANGKRMLGRNDNSNTSAVQAVAEDINAIEFLYFDGAGLITAVPADVRSVQISVLARAGAPDLKYTNAMVYTPASGVPWDLNGPAVAGNAANDNFNRRQLVTIIRCRNLGL